MIDLAMSDTAARREVPGGRDHDNLPDSQIKDHKAFSAVQ